jgi:hypothetical protein
MTVAPGLKRVATCCVALLICAIAPDTHAASSEQEQSYQQALDEMLNDVGNPEKSFDFVRAAIEVGDVRGAVAALERMLLINPGLANIQLELGVLYLRYGNADLGRYHIDRALQAPNVPRVVRERAEALLAGSGGYGGRSFLRGQLSLAAHYESNANTAPAGSEVVGRNPFTGQDVLFELSSDSLEQSDNFFDLTLGLNHTYAFEGNSGHSFESNLLLYGNKYDELSNLDFALASIDVGPALHIGGSVDAPIVLRPFAAGSYDLLDGEHYLSAYGGGLELRMQASARTYSYVKVEYSNQEFYDTPTQFVSDRSGDYLSARAGIVRQLGRMFQLNADLALEQNDADTEYQSFSRYGGGVGAKMFFGHGGALPPWSIGLAARIRTAEYDAPDPQISARLVRDDTRYDGILTVDVPLSRALLLSIKGVYTDNDSNVPNYEFDNAGGSLGVSWRF